MLQGVLKSSKNSSTIARWSTLEMIPITDLRLVALLRIARWFDRPRRQVSLPDEIPNALDDVLQLGL